MPFIFIIEKVINNGSAQRQLQTGKKVKLRIKQVAAVSAWHSFKSETVSLEVQFQMPAYDNYLYYLFTYLRQGLSLLLTLAWD